MATFAELLEASLPEDAGEDSVSLVPLLNGSGEATREHAVSQSAKGLLAIRRGGWKLIFGRGSGGWSAGEDEQPGQLYELANDLGETTNLYEQRPDVVNELTKLMGRIVENGRSTPGPKRANDVEVRWQRFMKADFQ